MTYAELRDTLAAIAEHCDVVGLDLVEVNPTLDVGTGITSYLAARTVLEFLGNICRQPRWERRREARRRGARLTRWRATRSVASNEEHRAKARELDTEGLSTSSRPMPGGRETAMAEIALG